jgi:hypothetical protein
VHRRSFFKRLREEGRAGKGQTTVFERATPSRETAAAPQGFARREPRAGALRTTIATTGEAFRPRKE